MTRYLNTIVLPKYFSVSTWLVAAFQSKDISKCLTVLKALKHIGAVTGDASLVCGNVITPVTIFHEANEPTSSY